MARTEPARVTGRRARKHQQRQQQKQQQKLWPPVAMCAALAVILTLSIALGRPAETQATATASVLPSASVAPATSETTAAATTIPSPQPTPAPRPSYNPSANDPFDQAYQRYHDEILAKKYAGQTVADLDVFAQEGMTPRWFGLTPNDLPTLRDKLLAGSPTAYTMSLVSLVMGYDPPAHPKEDDLTSCQAWLQDFEARRSAAVDPVSAQSKNIGSFALPAAYEKLESAENTELFDQLPAWTNGFDGLTQADTAQWTQADWMVWLRNRQDTWAAIHDFLQNPIVLPWVEDSES